MINWPVKRHVIRACKTRSRVLLPLVVVSAMLTTLIVGGPPAQAGTSGATNPGCEDVIGASFSAGCLPPDLLTLSGLYAATPAEADSLQDFELTATANTIADHGLASTDGNAVLTWGRSEDEAELFSMIEQSITDCTATCTTDEQNVVDWVQSVEQREAVAAAEDAGLEYVKWAGLNEATYKSLLPAGATGLSTAQASQLESTLQTFFATPGYPDPYSPTNQAGSGYCQYQPPAPYTSDYTDPTSAATCNGQPPPLGYLPPSPTYDQFAEFGEADENYALLDTTGYLSTAGAYATGAAFGFVVGGLVAGSAIGTIVAKNLTYEENLQAVENRAAVPTSSSPSSTVSNLSPATETADLADTAEAADESDSFLDPITEALSDAVDALSTVNAADALTIITVVVTALTLAIEEGISVAYADALPGQLAGLISNAETTSPPAPDVTTSSGQAALYTLFVGASLPVPANQTCDNSSPIPPGVTVTAGSITSEGSTPSCLNPTPIPPASPTDPQFVVEEQGSTTGSTASSITWDDAVTGTTTTARLSGNWFVLNGSTQDLSITYTDWAGDEQVAWLVGSPSTGYGFVGFNATTALAAGTQLDPSTCLADGACWTSPTIDYVSDGNDYSASVQSPITAAGTMTGDDPTGSVGVGTAVEGRPVEFDPTTFGPADAFNSAGQLVDPMSYTWQFQVPTCALGCLQVNGAEPQFTSPVTSTGAYTYTFPTSGSFLVQLTATDENTGEQASDTFAVQVEDVPPTLALEPDCPATQCEARTVPFGSAMSLAGTVTHAGTDDIENVFVDWGDGTVDRWYCSWVGTTFGPAAPARPYRARSTACSAALRSRWSRMPPTPRSPSPTPTPTPAAGRTTPPSRSRTRPGRQPAARWRRRSPTRRPQLR